MPESGPRTRLVVIGGFLGAGKTTLLSRTAVHLSQKGLRVGLITNDQAENLVDTAVLRESGFTVGEVAGGCFCCRFDTLVSALRQLGATVVPDVILSEPVGSCTDLAATVLRPVQEYLGDQYHVAPLSVLVDPGRMRHILRGDWKAPFPESIFYIFESQIREADLLLLTKCDLYHAADLDALESKLEARFPGKPILRCSQAAQAGFDQWVDLVLGGQRGGSCSIAVDYDLYARGEAALGWLNATVEVSRDSPEQVEEAARLFLEEFIQQCSRQRPQLEIAHAKLAGKSASGGFAGNCTGGSEGLYWSVYPEGQGPSRSGQWVFNARVVAAPEELQAVFTGTCHLLAQIGWQYKITHLNCFSPARPEPQYRIR